MVEGKINIIKSPDVLRGDRLPPGQRLIDKLPVLHAGKTHNFDIEKWRFRISGLVGREIELNFSEFQSLPRIQVLSDIHCVTGWSKLDNLWEGISSKTISELTAINQSAKFVIVHAVNEFTTNIPLKDFLQPDVLFALKLDNKTLSPEHGYPVRLVIPRLYFWKSAKWVTGIEYSSEDKPGYWETRGYHNYGDPWKEQRYSEY